MRRRTAAGRASASAIGGVAAGAEAQHVHRVHVELVQNREDVAGGVLGGEGPAGGLGTAVALLLNGNHLAVFGQQRDEFAEVGADGGAAARDEEQRRPAGHRLPVDLVIHAKAVVVRVAVGEGHRSVRPAGIDREGHERRRLVRMRGQRGAHDGVAPGTRVDGLDPGFRHLLGGSDGADGRVRAGQRREAPGAFEAERAVRVVAQAARPGVADGLPDSLRGIGGDVDDQAIHGLHGRKSGTDRC